MSNCVATFRVWLSAFLNSFEFYIIVWYALVNVNVYMG